VAFIRARWPMRRVCRWCRRPGVGCCCARRSGWLAWTKSWPRRWRRGGAGSHDPAKIVCDLAITLALGGDCLADVALLRRTRPVRPGLGPDRVACGGCAGRRRAPGAGGDQPGSGSGAGPGLGAGRRACPESRRGQRVPTTRDRRGRHNGWRSARPGRRIRVETSAIRSAIRSGTAAEYWNRTKLGLSAWADQLDPLVGFAESAGRVGVPRPLVVADVTCDHARR
jgi:hypothetical protein